MWAMGKDRIRRSSRLPTSEDELWEAIQQAWEWIPVATVNRLIDGMPRRPELVKLNKRFSFSY